MHLEIPTPLPDETLVSALERGRARMGYPARTFYSRLFAEKRLVPGSHFCGHLDPLAERLQKLAGWSLSGEDLLEKHTLAPVVLPFLPSKTRMRVEKILRSGGADDGSDKRAMVIPHALIGTTKQTLVQSCPGCRARDRAQFGEAYEHRVHQIPGVNFCPHCQMQLERTTILAQGEAHTALSECSRFEKVRVARSTDENQLRFAREAWELLRAPVTPFFGFTFQLSYRLLAAEQGIDATTPAKIRTDWAEFFGIAMLQTAGALTMRRGMAPIAAIFSKAGAPVRPQVRLLAAVRLSKPITELIEYGRALRFDHGPWRCINPRCSCHNKEVIHLYTQHSANELKFTCPECLTSYLRSESLGGGPGAHAHDKPFGTAAGDARAKQARDRRRARCVILAAKADERALSSAEHRELRTLLKHLTHFDRPWLDTAVYGRAAA